MNDVGSTPVKKSSVRDRLLRRKALQRAKTLPKPFVRLPSDKELRRDTRDALGREPNGFEVFGYAATLKDILLARDGGRA